MSEGPGPKGWGSCLMASLYGEGEGADSCVGTLSAVNRQNYRQTLLKTLSSRNPLAGGNNVTSMVKQGKVKQIREDTGHCESLRVNSKSARNHKLLIER